MKFLLSEVKALSLCSYINKKTSLADEYHNGFPVLFLNQINQYSRHLPWPKCQVSAKPNLCHGSDHNTQLIEFHVSKTANIEITPIMGHSQNF